MSQQEILSWINKYLTKQFICEPSELPEDECLNEAREILSYLHSQGVVIKVDREPSTYLNNDGEERYYGDMPYEMYEDGWRRFEPLIREGK